MIQDEIICKIKRATRLEDIVSKYVELKQDNPNSPWLVGLCPFHKDTKTPNFKVNVETQTWFCFSCKKGIKDSSNDELGSDVIAFVRSIEECEFPEAMKILADHANIELIFEKENTEYIAEKKSKTEHNRRYFKNLWNENNDLSINALNYLRSRGLNDASIKKWRLGLVPNDEIKYRNVTNIAGKIAFPMIENTSSDNPSTLSMSYRSPMDNPPKPKYKNDTNTPHFKKGDHLYGLNFAHKAIRKKKFGIIVECYFGAIMLHQIGIENVVSISGTNISEEQMYQMKKYSNNWVLMLDSDAAGLHAMIDVLPTLLTNGFNIDMALLPQGLDADELAQNLTMDDFNLWFAESKISMLDYVINKELNKYEEKINHMKVNVLSKLNNILTGLKSPKAEVYKSMINKRLDL